MPLVQRTICEPNDSLAFVVADKIPNENSLYQIVSVMVSHPSGTVIHAQDVRRCENKLTIHIKIESGTEVRYEIPS
jgi:hypothetical protein